MNRSEIWNKFEKNIFKRACRESCGMPEDSLDETNIEKNSEDYKQELREILEKDPNLMGVELAFLMEKHEGEDWVKRLDALLELEPKIEEVREEIKKILREANSKKSLAKTAKSFGGESLAVKDKNVANIEDLFAYFQDSMEFLESLPEKLGKGTEQNKVERFTHIKTDGKFLKTSVSAQPVKTATILNILKIANSLSFLGCNVQANKLDKIAKKLIIKTAMEGIELIESVKKSLAKASELLEEAMYKGSLPMIEESYIIVRDLLADVVEFGFAQALKVAKLNLDKQTKVEISIRLTNLTSFIIQGLRQIIMSYCIAVNEKGILYDVLKTMIYDMISIVQYVRSTEYYNEMKKYNSLVESLVEERATEPFVVEVVEGRDEFSRLNPGVKNKLDRILELKRRIAEAIHDEEYEKAAELKEQLNRLL